MIRRALVQDPTATIITGGSIGDRLHDDTFLVVQDEEGRLVDLDRGRFYALDPIGTQLLTLALEQGRASAATRVSADYDEPVARVRADLDRLMQDLRRKGLLVGSGGHPTRFARWQIGTGAMLKQAGAWPTRPGPPPSIPGRRTISRWLMAAWFQLRLLGWGTTVRRWSRWHRAAEVVDPSDRRRVVQEVHRVVCDAAARHLFLPMSCKERALVGHQVLRGVFGLPAELVVGIKRYPFGAHAWVECEGMIVTDDRAHCELFTPVARYE